jgi:hypothetical protein
VPWALAHPSYSAKSAKSRPKCNIFYAFQPRQTEKIFENTILRRFPSIKTTIKRRFYKKQRFMAAGTPAPGKL